MHCGACLEPMPVASVFPGGRVVCAACGLALEVPETSEPVRGSPYREASPPRQEQAEQAEPARPAARPPAGRAATCPRCPGVALDDADATLSCPRCSGRFVSHAHLRSVVESTAPSQPAAPPPRPSTRAAESVSYLRCPSCSAMMNRRNFGERSGVVVDVCKTHGVWLDRGELDAVVAFVSRLPETDAVRKALLGLVHRPLPPPSAPAVHSPIYVPTSLERELQEAAAGARLLSWLGELFR